MNYIDVEDEELLEFSRTEESLYDTNNPVPVDSRVITKKQEEESKYRDTDLWG